MNVYTESDRYTVLLHAFDTFEGACEYMTQIINVGECKVLPLIKAWKGGVVTAKWMAKKTEKGVAFELLDSDFTYVLSDKIISTILKKEDEDERNDIDVVYLVKQQCDGFYYTTGSSAYIIENNFKTELQQKKSSLAYVTRFPIRMVNEVKKRLIASGYKVSFV